MRVETRLFGEIDIAEEKIITLGRGLIGYPDMKRFTLIFDELAREKYVDWFGYSASVSPYILEQFEKEVGYAFRPEYIIDQGYMNNT